MEIYNEEVKDLLHPDTPSKLISIREDANGDIILAGVKEEVVTNFESMIRSVIYLLALPYILLLSSFHLKVLLAPRFRDDILRNGNRLKLDGYVIFNQFESMFHLRNLAVLVQLTDLYACSVVVLAYLLRQLESVRHD